MLLARLRPHLATALAVALLLAGVVLLASAQQAVATCGFFSYTPLHASGRSRSVVLTGRQLSGSVLVGLGLLVLAADVGHRLGRRRR